MAIWKLATSIRKKTLGLFYMTTGCNSKNLRLFLVNVKCREFLISYGFLPSYYSHSWASITILFSNSFMPTNSVQSVILYPGNNWQLPPCQKSMKLNVLSAQFRRVATKCLLFPYLGLTMYCLKVLQWDPSCTAVQRRQPPCRLISPAMHCVSLISALPWIHQLIQDLCCRLNEQRLIPNILLVNKAANVLATSLSNQMT